MAEIGLRWLSTLVPALDEGSASELRSGLPALVTTGEITLYVRVPAGKAVYMGGIQPRPTTIKDAISGSHRYLSPYALRQTLDAERAGMPVIRYPTVVPGAVYLGLTGTDARLLLELGRVDVHWFPCAVQFSPQPGMDTKQLAQGAPRLSPCCLRPDDGQPKRGPWIGHDPDHALTINLRDVLVEQGALKNALRGKEDPFGLRDTSVGMYVLYRAAAHFNAPVKGVTAAQTEVQTWTTKEAKDYRIKDWLFNKAVLKQVRKLINTQHNERQGVKEPTVFDRSVLSNDEARAIAELHYVSVRLILAVHATRRWHQIVSSAGRPWDTIEPDHQMRMVNDLRKTLESLKITDAGERDAVMSVVIYPARLSDIRRQQKVNLQTRS